MKMIGYKFSLMGGLLLLVSALAPPMAAQVNINKIDEPSEVQQEIIDSIFSDLSYEQNIIQSYFQDLEDLDMVDQNQKTRLSLATTIKSEPVRREHYLINEEAFIQWKGKNIVDITFYLRKGLIGTGVIIKRHLTYHVIPTTTDTTAPPIDFVVSEYINTNMGENVNFRYPAGTGSVRDHKEKVNIGGVEKEIMVIYIRDVNSRIKILRENNRLLNRLRRRIEWLIDKRMNMRKNKVKRYLDF